ncbi:transposase, partial [Jannaschia formosa]
RFIWRVKLSSTASAPLPRILHRTTKRVLRSTIVPTDERLKGRCIDNIFIERLWRSLKYECVYLHAWETGSQAKAGVARWITFYNHQRPHAAHGGQPPAVVYFDGIQTDQQVQAVA